MDSYQPSHIETKWYDFWEKSQFFSPDHPSQKNRKETYTIVIPPPNVTGSLHVGHALVNTLQDVIIRWKRMLGYKTLWLPGTDHAGIATQMVVERELASQGIKRKEIGREKFVEEVWKWKELYGNTIFGQLKRLGASLDWKRERFTLDEMLSKAVKKSFVDFYKEGLIYRGEYLINWCPKCLTALSDLEVDHEEREGSLTHLSYPLEDGQGQMVVATTRPETMLGDTAVAVHPDDNRYKHLVGKNLILPLVKRVIPIIADEFVDMEFGTGAVKVTPAHDPNDFQMGLRHNLENVNIFTKDAKINNVYQPLEGLDRFEARKQIVKLLKEAGSFQNADKHSHAVGQCQRCKTIVEPSVSTQWFCKMTDMANAALEAAEKEEVVFYPVNQKKIFQEWLKNIQDWCLSRQLWWGHQIPAFYCQKCGETVVTEASNVKSCPKCGSSDMQQEQDVLDTWFSSGLFPFSTMGWPDDTQDYQDFYPNSTLLTGYDILFFWVARMIMMGIKQTGKVPFKDVFLNGLVRDANGEKMSKTKGNVIDPLEVVDKFGADALRFTLTSLTVMGRDSKLSDQILEGNRNFINKFWNATRFTLSHIERLGKPKPIDSVSPGVFDKWIINQLKEATIDMNRHLEAFRFNEAAKSVYSFVWHSFCDWYVEIIKPVLFNKLGDEAQDAALATVCYVLDQSLRLLHPLTPFVTEELWQKLNEVINIADLTGNTKDSTLETLMLAPFPVVEEAEIISTVNAENLIEMINVIRNIRGENNVKPNIKVNVTLVTSDSNMRQNISVLDELLKPLAGIKSITLKDQFEKADGIVGGVGKVFEIFIDLAETIDVAAEIKRLEKEKGRLVVKQTQLEKKLANQGFLSKAPETVIQKVKNELAEFNDKISKIKENLKTFQKF
ncbi:MAG: valine--tRNA ligase [Deltaproteobacteria bacterium]|jgi:valyl-tRNA synthetase|nr:valine--tRNA ligase [Deltaproteobacteria bacterium]